MNLYYKKIGWFIVVILVVIGFLNYGLDLWWKTETNNTDWISSKISWTLLEGENIQDEQVYSAVDILDSASIINQQQSFLSFQDNQFIKKMSDWFDVKINFSSWFSSDSLLYSYNWNSFSYVLPYNNENEAKLDSPECEGIGNYDSILCYMPRINWVYWPFNNLFASWAQLVYTVSVFQWLHNQYVLDIWSQKEFPFMDRLFLMYFTDDFKKIIAVEKWDVWLYKNVAIFENVWRRLLKDWAVDSLFYDGTHIFIVEGDNESWLSNISIYSLLENKFIVDIKDIDIWEVAEFALDGNKLYINYVDVSFVQEKEYYYILEYDIESNNQNWKVELHQ